MSALPALDTPVKLGSNVVVFEGTGKRFRISEDHPSFEGHHLLGHEGEMGCYAYYRETTDEERAEYDAREQAREVRVKVQAAAVKLARQVQETGTKPEGHHILDGERIMDSQDIYGGGDWWLLQETEGMDGDNWAHNNVTTGGAGAIGWWVSYTEELAKQLRDLEQATKA